jgi:hypothetical protein
MTFGLITKVAGALLLSLSCNACATGRVATAPVPLDLDCSAQEVFRFAPSDLERDGIVRNERVFLSLVEGIHLVSDEASFLAIQQLLDSSRDQLEEGQYLYLKAVLVLHLPGIAPEGVSLAREEMARAAQLGVPLAVMDMKEGLGDDSHLLEVARAGNCSALRSLADALRGTGWNGRPADPSLALVLARRAAMQGHGADTMLAYEHWMTPTEVFFWKSVRYIFLLDAEAPSRPTAYDGEVYCVLMWQASSQLVQSMRLTELEMDLRIRPFFIREMLPCFVRQGS